MGSYDMCTMSGFICRLCSELNKKVIHVYSNKGQEMNLAEMINYIPIQVSPVDSLPLTVCTSCIGKLEIQYRLIEQIKRARKKFTEQAQLRNRINTSNTETTQNQDCPLHDESTSSTSSNDS